MAASITTSTRFTIILLGYDTIRKVVNGIGWATDETPAGGGGVYLENTGISTTQQTMKITLQSYRRYTHQLMDSKMLMGIL